MNFLLQPPKNAAKARLCLQKTLVLEVRKWLGMRFVHQGRGNAPVGDVGVDCLGLLIGLATRLDLRGRDGRLLSQLDQVDYGLRPDGATLRARMESALEPGMLEEEGNILLFRLQGNPQHLGLSTRLEDGRMGLLHAHAPLGRVVEHGFTAPWPQRFEAAFGIPLEMNTHLLTNF